MDVAGLKLLAVRLGDLLKGSTGVNEISRVAEAALDVPCEEFPNEHITSVRAQTTYNWMMSVGKQPLPDDERCRRVTAFALALVSDSEKPVVRRWLVDAHVPKRVVYKAALDRFEARDFHSEVTFHARDRFIDEDYFHAAFEVCKAFDKAVQAKKESPATGQALMLQAWGCDRGWLKVTRCASETDRDIQDGLKFMSAGLMAAVRNPLAHELAQHWVVTAEDCLDMLSLASYLFRRLDRVTVFPP